MQKQSVDKTKRFTAIRGGAQPSSIRTFLLSLEVGQSVVFDPGEWTLRSSVHNYVTTFKRIGRKYSIRTTPEGKKVIMRLE